MNIPRLVAFTLANTVMFVASPQSPAAAAARPNIVWLLLDTARADADVNDRGAAGDEVFDGHAPAYDRSWSMVLSAAAAAAMH